MLGRLINSLSGGGTCIDVERVCLDGMKEGWRVVGRREDKIRNETKSKRRTDQLNLLLLGTESRG